MFRGSRELFQTFSNEMQTLPGLKAEGLYSTVLYCTVLLYSTPHCSVAHLCPAREDVVSITELISLFFYTFQYQEAHWCTAHTHYYFTLHTAHTHYYCTLVHSTYTLLLHTAHTHYYCTLHIHTIIAHCTYTLLLHTAHTHYYCTLHTYILISPLLVL